MKIACFSVAALDFYPQQNRWYAGGNSLNQAVRYRQMGHESAFVGAVGTDEAGDRVEALLRAAAVDVSRLRRLEGITARNQIVNDEAGERYGIEGAWENGVYGDFQLGDEDWAYIAGFDVWTTHANSPCYPSALERKRPGQFMSVDFLHLQDYDLLKASLRAVEIAYFGGTEDMVADLARVAREHPGVIVLTLGAQGSIAFEGSRTYPQPALPVEKVVDTTGCGDAFQAACTACYIRTRDIRASLLAGAELGRQATQTYGGAPWEAVDAAMP